MINWIKNKIFSKYTRRHRASNIIPNGTLLSKDYRIEKFIGSGGFSDVYLARHTKLHTKHAVKVIKSISFPNHKLYELFIQEAKVLYRLRHDSVVRYEGFSQDEEGRYFLVMEYVDGPTLTKVYRKRPLSVEEIYVLRDRLAGGLIAAHELNIIHRDISPANVILPGGKIEKAKLIDFGISKLANPGNKESIERHFFGKYRFASPEQIGVFPAEVGIRSDLYSLGLLLVASAIGHPLDTEDTREAVMPNRQMVPDLSSVPSELHDQLVAMLQPDPDGRPQDLRKLLERWPAPIEAKTVLREMEEEEDETVVEPIIPFKEEETPPIDDSRNRMQWIYKWIQLNKLKTLSLVSLVLIVGLFFFIPHKKSNVNNNNNYPKTTETRPLLMKGKHTLYQRILTRPGAVLFQSPIDENSGLERVPPLSIFYVYKRSEFGGKQWIEVGAENKAPTKGWLEKEKTIDWKQTLMLAFTKTGDREPALFFRDYDYLVKLIKSDKRISDVDRIRTQIRKGDIPENFPVISIEPDTYIDPNKHFYLLPILGLKEISVKSFPRKADWKLFNVAAVTLHESKPDLFRKGAISAIGSNYKQILKDYRVGIVFVIDTTSSMGPYIDRTRSAVRRIYQKLKHSKYGQNMSFGVVAFRDNKDAAPGLEYVSRIFATLKDGLNENTFMHRMNQVKSTNVSSKGFNEDPYAGIYDAITKLNWQGYDGRYIVLITDAGARRANDPLSRTGYDAEVLRTFAKEKDQEKDQKGGMIAIAVMHLLTPEGKNNHDQAARQYNILSRWGDSGSWYYPVQNGSVPAFSHQVNKLVDDLLSQVENASKGILVEVPPDNTSTELERMPSIIGRAMQLAFIGRAKDTEAPTLINAWVPDSDLAKRSQKTVEMRVLITKDQLSDLYKTLKTIIAAREKTFNNPKDFFNQLRSAAAIMARDPDNVNQVQRLGDLSRQAEWLDDLPGRSPIMNITEDRWLGYSRVQQEQLVDHIKERIRLYEEISNNTDRWVDLSETGEKGEAVTTIPVDKLP